MATQHPDNASGPAWSSRGSGYISLEMEVDEAYRNFSELGIPETMWDNEGKHVDYSIAVKLVHEWPDYFANHQLGSARFVTYRIPNRWQQRGAAYRQALAAITAENETLADYGFNSPALFEVILPFTQDVFQLLGLQHDYVTGTPEGRAPKLLEIIPLFEGPDMALHIHSVLNGYIDGMRTIWSLKPSYLRPFIARSDPALDSGFVAAELFVATALSECFRFSAERKVPVFPVIGAGSAPFRGGLAPHTVKAFAAKYPGCRTATIQSAFRYDYPQQLVAQGLNTLQELLPATVPVILTDRERRHIIELIEAFARPYKLTITATDGGSMPIADLVNRISGKFIPSHRARLGHVGFFGYSRTIRDAPTAELPRAIKFTAALMSLGIPPELIGFADGLRAACEADLEPLLMKACPSLAEDMTQALGCVNTEVLAKLAHRSHVWERLQGDVAAAAAFAGVAVGPKTPQEEAHSAHTSGVYEAYVTGDDPTTVQAAVMRAAETRHYLG